MSSKLENFHSHFDDCFPVSGNFDHHVASAYTSTPKRAQNQQHSKMPGLLRLDSVGEVSSPRPPSDSQVYNSRANTKPVLRNCKSVDTPYSNRFLTKSNMATAKSLTRSPSTFHSDGQQTTASLLTKVHAFAQELQPQLGKTAHSYGAKTSSSPFIFGQSSDFTNVLSMFAPAKINNYSNLYNSPSSPSCPVVNSSLLKSFDNFIGRGQDGKTASILSTVAAACAASFQPTSSYTVPPGSQPFLGSDRKDAPNVLKSSELPGIGLINQKDDILNVAKSAELSGTDVKQQDSLKNVETQDLNASFHNASKAESDSSVIFDEKFAEEVCFPIIDSSLNKDVLQWPSDNCTPSGKRSRNCTSKNGNDRNSNFDDSLHNSLKSVVEISSVLSAPRKTVKKGRPSSKKQKKRQREKQRHESSPCLFTRFPCSSNNISKVETEVQTQGSPSISVCQSVDSHNSMPETAKTVFSTSIPRVSSVVKPQSKCSISSLFYVMSDVDDTDGDDDSDESCDWSDSEDQAVYIPPIKCSTFNVALNLDMIFKRKSIPSLKSVLGADESDSDSEASSLTQSAQDKHGQSVSLCTSNDSSSEDTSVGACAPLVAASAALAPFGFTMGLSLDSLFIKKSSLCNQNEATVANSTSDVVDGLPQSPNTPHLSSSVESDVELMNQINDKWNENYPSAGFRSCQDTSANEVTDSSIKVHFATGAQLKTVHIVGTEDRAGNWHHCVLDRERFQRRVLDLEKVISPVFEASYRAKVLKQNQLWESRAVPKDI